MAGPAIEIDHALPLMSRPRYYAAVARSIDDRFVNECGRFVFYAAQNGYSRLSARPVSRGLLKENLLPALYTPIYE
jgi:hypothetical protein